MFQPNMQKEVNMTVEEILHQRRQLELQKAEFDKMLKAKLQEKQAGFASDVLAQLNAMDYSVVEFVGELTTQAGLKSPDVTPKEIFDAIAINDEALETWSSEFNILKNSYFREKKTPLFKIPKNTVKGISDTKFSTIYIEDITGGPKAIEKLAQKIGATKAEAMKKLAERTDGVWNFDDPSTPESKAMDMLYPAKKATAKTSK